MRVAVIVICVFVLAGCARSAAPKFFNGDYYLVGDSACVKFFSNSPGRVICFDKKGNNNGYRYAMTYEQVQIYHARMLERQEQIQQLSQSLQEVGRTFNNNSQQILQQSRQYSAPQVQPITPQGGYNGATYRNVGNTWIGSDGSSCQTAGNSILCSDGKRCQVIGSSLICN